MVWHVYTDDWDETREAFLQFVEERRAAEREETPAHLSDEEADDYDLLTDGGA